MKIFFTGVTGFLGRFVATRLLKEGNYMIFLARGKNGISAKERTDMAICYVDPKSYEKYRDNYKVVGGDITEDNLGLPEDYALEIALEVDEVWHTAGSISFSEKERNKIESTNFTGAIRVIDFINIVKPRKFHYFSTAYVNDDEVNVVLESDLNCEKLFNNPYENSKCNAEVSVRKWARENPKSKTFIYRPSIVVGNSVNGMICSFSGYYRYMRTYYSIKRAIQRRLDSVKFINGDGILHLPINVPGKAKSTINIATVDYVVNSIMQLRKADVAGVYHITNENPPTYEWLLKEGLRVMGIHGPSANDGNNRKDEEAGEFLESIEAHIKKGLCDYHPYITRNIIFDKSNVKEVLGKEYREHPEFTSELIEILLKYAMLCEFKEDPRIGSIKLLVRS